MKIAILRHNDLDGVACSIVVRKYLERFKRSDYELEDYICDYKNIDSVFSSFLRETDVDYLLMLDISPSEDNLNLIAETENIFVVDHHKTFVEKLIKLRLINKNNFIYSKNDCGAKLIYDNIKSILEIDDLNLKTEYDELLVLYNFVLLVNDYDLWIHNHTDSKKLNTLFRVLGDEGFIKRCMSSDKPHQLSLMEEAVVRASEEKKQKRIELLADNLVYKYDDNGILYAVTLDSSCINDLADYLRKCCPNCTCSYLIGIDLINLTASLRSIKADFDVAEVAKRYGGGGHKGAAGFNLGNGMRLRVDTINFLMDNI